MYCIVCVTLYHVLYLTIFDSYINLLVYLPGLNYIMNHSVSP